MFFVKNSKNSLWLTNSTVQNTEITIGIFLFFILFYFLHPNLIMDFATSVGLSLF
jgi:hypothetical protein